MKQATLADVANYAGVSKASCSYYFRGKKKLSHDLEQKLEEGARVLKYTPSHIRNMLEVTKKMKQINLCITVNDNDDRDEMYIFCMMNGVLDCLVEQGYHLLFNRLVEGDEKSRKLFITSLDNTTGVILCNNKKDHCLEDELKKREIPYIILGTPENVESDFYVNVDLLGVGFQATEHLLAKGHRRILFINMSEAMLQSKQRLEGFEMAYEKRGIEFRYEDHVYAPVSTDICCQIVKEYFLKDNSYTAVLTSNEMQAQGVIRAMTDLKIPVPSKVAIISMGGTRLGTLTVPSLTTIDFNPHKHGYEAACLLIDVLEKKRIQPFHLILRGNLVERDSTRK